LLELFVINLHKEIKMVTSHKTTTGRYYGYHGYPKINYLRYKQFSSNITARHWYFFKIWWVFKKI